MEEYAINLLNNLLDIDRKNKYVLFFNSFKKPKINLSKFEKYENVSVKKFNYPNKVLNFLFWYFNWPKIDKLIGGADVIFFPNIIFSAWSKKTKAVFTVHDLSFERRPETFSLKRRLWHVFINPKKLCRKADRIISVSDSTKNDLREIYRIPEAKIKTIYSGISENFKVIDRNNQKLVEVKSKYNLPYKFILYLGTIEPRKNIIGIVRAYNQLRKINHTELNKYKMVIAGASGWKQERIFKEIKNSSFKNDIIFSGFIDDEDKPAVYNLSSLFIYPSFFEGFGFPPLEAMACGAPAITSNNSSFPEITGSAGIMIDPDRPDEIFQAMKNILSDKNLRENLIKKGLERAKKFNWQKTAREFLEVLDKKYRP